MEATSLDRTLLRNRLELLHALEAELQAAQAALLQRNLEKLNLHTARELGLCHALQDNAAQIAGSPAAGSLSAAYGRDRQLELASELNVIEKRIRYWNRVHAALLRRACRSLAILERLWSSASGIYTAPNLEPKR